jgi:VIT1/CCC1 family predicted Fe2+/Mn2+ transporter
VSAADQDEAGRVLDPVERITEVMFGLLMALTFTGTLSVASAGREEVRTMMLTALGCNIAWGLADAVMYLVRTVTARTRNRTLLRQIQAAVDAAAGRRVVADALPQSLVDAVGADALEPMRARLAAAAVAARGPLLRLRDWRGAFGVFLLVVLATFPVVIPFMVFEQTALAMRASNAVSVAMLFAAGWTLASYAGGSRWRGGLAMAVVGILLIIAIIALGG